MRREIKFSESMGKTIEAVRYDLYGPQAVITFTDGTFSTIVASHDSYEGESTIDDDKLDIFSFLDDDLFELGILTKEEYEEKSRARDKKISDENSMWEVQQYQALKAKFKGSIYDREI